MIQTRPIYEHDYKPGTVIFTNPVDAGFISKGITWFQSFEESCEFVASHVSLVVDEFTGIESAEKGVEFFPLSRYFGDDSYQVVCREPLDMTPFDAEQAIEAMKRMESKETNYDYTGLLGYAIKIVFPLNRIFPFLNKLPVPFHMPASYFCSAAVALSEKQTDKYKNAQIFKDYHVSRISPVVLYNHFPFKPFSYTRKREVIYETVQPDTIGLNLTRLTTVCP